VIFEILIRIFKIKVLVYMDKSKVYIIAEVGVNHNGDVNMAKELIDVAKSAGADAVKFQTYVAEHVVLPYTDKAFYQRKEKSESQLEMLKNLELSKEEQLEIKEYAVKNKIEFISSPFDLESLNFLVEVLNIPIIKIASGEITNAPLLLKAAMSGKKLIISTGMSTLGEIENALGVVAFGYKKYSNAIVFSKSDFKKAYHSEEGQKLLEENVALLHCTSSYPPPFNEINLKAIKTLKKCFRVSAGYSDHTEGTAVAVAAVALGAKIIEKHITLDKNLLGPDHKISLEPHELCRMVKEIRQVEGAIGESYKKPAMSEEENIRLMRKSIVAARDIKKGEFFMHENLMMKRPQNGISPMKLWEITGRRATRDYKKDEVILE
jgi:N-acetylneuraminate synthase